VQRLRYRDAADGATFLTKRYDTRRVTGDWIAWTVSVLPVTGGGYVQTMVFGRNMIRVKPIDITRGGAQTLVARPTLWAQVSRLLAAAAAGADRPLAQGRLRLFSSGHLDFIETIRQGRVAGLSQDAAQALCVGGGLPAPRCGFVHLRREREQRLFRVRASGSPPARIRERHTLKSS